ncbi:MsnO8 family LLM class oxidoreductase [Aureimonas psammosilenae]|uniref:MsnO8 family LLM class oxidoreductase n=1 Tax=Aureimonas psammosilenae TaxID=2495496 RepID=UPI0012606168|nr:MsnO8 family LLM class oxidoreductase [Aureimonas psammosilenae]
MTYRLSILDKSPIAPSTSAGEALATSLAYAELADSLGYHRFWVAEHHGTNALASAAPEVLASHLLARTRRIRIGTGGVLLQHYSPFKVAELFGVLSALAPGRVDLGIGKAPGGLPLGTKALQAELATPRHSFDAKLRDLDLLLSAAAPEGHPLAGAEALPRAAVLPERFLLGASEASAALAAELGWGFVHAGHHDGDANAIERSLAAARIAGPQPILAVTAIAAPTREEARAAADYKVFKLHLPGGQAVNLGSLDAAEEYARQLGVRPIKVEERRPEVLAGTPDDIHAALGGLARRHGVTEFVLDSPIADRADRLRSIELIAAVPRRAAA